MQFRGFHGGGLPVGGKTVENFIHDVVDPIIVGVVIDWATAYINNRFDKR